MLRGVLTGSHDSVTGKGIGGGSSDRVVGGPSEEVTLAPSLKESAMQIAGSGSVI